MGLTLYARSTHHFAYQEFREAVEVGSESIEYLREASDVWNLANILGYVGTARGWLGRFEGAAELGDRRRRAGPPARQLVGVRVRRTGAWLP